MRLFAKLMIGVVVLALAFTGYRLWYVQHSMDRLANVTLGAAFGPADAKDVVVEFMDYRCSFCRAIGKDVEEFTRRNPDIRLVIRHFPIFGEPSVREARFAIAAARQDKFAPVHRALLAREEPASDADLQAIANDVGLDWAQAQSDMEDEALMDHLLETVDRALFLKIDRTPAFLIKGGIYIPENYMPTATDFEALLGRAPSP